MKDKTAEIQEIKKAIKAHRSKPRIRRLGSWALGKSPSREDKEKLRLHELGPYGRSVELAGSAIRWSNRVNRTPRATLGGAWITAQSKSPFGGSILTPVHDTHRQLLEELFASRESTIEATFDSVGIFLDTDSKHPIPHEIRGIGIAVVNEVDVQTNSLVLSQAEILGLPEESQTQLEGLLGYINNHARGTYIMNKPDNH